eukprot:bmy_13730T0
MPTAYDLSSVIAGGSSVGHNNLIPLEPVSIHRPSETSGRPGRASSPSPQLRGSVARGSPAESSGWGGARPLEPLGPLPPKGSPHT